MIKWKAPEFEHMRWIKGKQFQSINVFLIAQHI